MNGFRQFSISERTYNAVSAMGFETPTPIQVQAIPHLLQGRDIIGQARTGTGKTAAFGLPLVEALAAQRTPGVHGLVLVPTRELALQVAEQLEKIAHGTELRVVAIYGGTGFGKQNEALAGRRPLIVVATPGRLLDHQQAGRLRLDAVRFLVLDEADRMLDMGFLPDVERIVRLCPRQRQTALFSATLPPRIEDLTHRFLQKPERVRVESGPTATPLAQQYRVDCDRHQKPAALQALLEKETPKSAIVFTRTKHLARRLAVQLDRKGWPAVALQGNMSQPQRERALRSFRDGESRILVATDVASRGLDIADVSHVVNYDIPEEPEAYVHRVGRTARMGRTGRAFTFVQGDQRRDLADVERTAGITLETFDLGPLPKVDPLPQEQGRGERGFHRGGGQRSSRPPQGRRQGERRSSQRGPFLPRPRQESSSADRGYGGGDWR